MFPISTAADMTTITLTYDLEFLEYTIFIRHIASPSSTRYFSVTITPEYAGPGIIYSYACNSPAMPIDPAATPAAHPMQVIMYLPHTAQAATYTARTTGAIPQTMHKPLTIHRIATAITPTNPFTFSLINIFPPSCS